MSVLDRYFAALRAHDWKALADCVADDVERRGPYFDVVRGRQAYVDFLAGVLPTLRSYSLAVHAIHRLADGRALALLSESLDVDGVPSEFPEVILFDFDASGRIARLDIYTKHLPPGFKRAEA